MAEEKENRRRRTVIVIVIVALLIVAALLLWLWLMRQPAAPTPAAEPPLNQPAASLPATNAPITNSAVSQPVTPTPGTQPTGEADARSTLRSLARSFAERLGSFSNAGNFENVLDLKVFMTPKLADWADKFVAQARASQPSSAEYSGTTTRTITAEVVSLDENAGRAEVKVKTQRHEVAHNLDNVYYQDLNLVFLKQGGTWKADAAVWGQKSADGT